MKKLRDKIQAEVGDKINDEKLDIITDYMSCLPKVALIESAAGTGKTSLLVAMSKAIKLIGGKDNEGK